MDSAGFQFAFRPFKVEREPSSRTEAFHFPFCPNGWQGGQEGYGSGVTLEEHFGYCGGGSEVAVDLENWAFTRRVGIEQIDVGAVLHQHGERLPGFIAVCETGPEADGPGAAPAGIRSSVCEAAFERCARGLRQGRRLGWGDLAPGIEAIEMGHVALTRGAFFEVDGPFLEFAVATDLERDEALGGGSELLREPGVNAEDFGGGDAVAE